MDKISITRSTVFYNNSVPDFALSTKLLERIDILEKEVKELKQSNAKLKAQRYLNL
ncbi:hypothetical protein [Latilactobacillus curvatus]|uniref:hypothetical protein n=1 Tax=Latilactobacillus curvatus TaxID=28038 RepID=UPI002D76C204|nr:hypothetical protein [Latilactobacillus curvatus]WRS47051.1 hypothetical protein VDS61_05160 [Latilactobacillus curvatus]